MHRTVLKNVCLATLLGLITSYCQAFSFSFPQPGNRSHPPRNQWEFRRNQQDHSRGTPPPSTYQAPGWQGRQQQQPGGAQYGRYGQSQSRYSSQPPFLEVQLNNAHPYVQQNVLLTVRVVSGGNLATATPELPQTESVLFQKLQGPTARSRTNAQGQIEIVNEFVYTLTPLRAGNIGLPPLRMEGTFAANSPNPGQSGTSFQATAPRSIQLRVQPAKPELRPWLPLEELLLRASVDGQDQAEEGKPLTLMLETAAIGATGVQLPSLESRLRSDNFRVYREKTETRGEVSKDGRFIMGKRIEYYTLVPQHGGRLQLPAIRIGWFNVTSGTIEHTTLPIRSLAIAGDPGDEGGFLGLDAVGNALGVTPWAFWIPLGGVLLLLSGYWLGVWIKGRAGSPRLLPATVTLLTPVVDRLRRPLGVLASHLNPRPYWQRLRRKALAAMPTPLHFWFCVRSVEGENDPSIWAQTLKSMACRQLELSPQAPMPSLAEKIVQLQPRSNPNRIRTLIRDLDSHVYGNQPLDFQAWKREFKKQVRPRLIGGGHPGRARGGLRSRLPELNPKAA